MANQKIILHPVINGVEDTTTNLYPKTSITQVENLYQTISTIEQNLNDKQNKLWASTGITLTPSGTISNNGVAYQTSAPTSANYTGALKFVVLSSEPATKYSGYVYIITN